LPNSGRSDHRRPNGQHQAHDWSGARRHPARSRTRKGAAWPGNRSGRRREAPRPRGRAQSRQTQLWPISPDRQPRRPRPATVQPRHPRPQGRHPTAKTASARLTKAPKRASNSMLETTPSIANPTTRCPYTVAAHALPGVSCPRWEIASSGLSRMGIAPWERRPSRGLFADLEPLPRRGHAPLRAVTCGVVVGGRGFEPLTP